MTAAARALAAPLAKAYELPGAAFLLALLAAGFALASPQFLSPANLANVALQSAALIIVSLGMTLVILTEGIDLSAGAVLGLCGVVMSMLLVSQGVPLPLAIGAAVVVGIAAGLCNGALVAYAGMPPFIVTLGVYGIAQSLAMVLTQGNSVTGLPPAVRWFNEGHLLGVPVPILAMVAIFALTWVLLYRTRFGRYVFAIGGNRRALELAGVPVREHSAFAMAFGDLWRLIDISRQYYLSVTWQAASRKHGRPWSKEMMAKFSAARSFAADVAEKVTTTSMEFMGAYGYSFGNQVEKYARDYPIVKLWLGGAQRDRMEIAHGLYGALGWQLPGEK